MTLLLWRSLKEIQTHLILIFKNCLSKKNQKTQKIQSNRLLRKSRSESELFQITFKAKKALFLNEKREALLEKKKSSTNAYLTQVRLMIITSNQLLKKNQNCNTFEHFQGTHLIVLESVQKTIA